MGEEEGLDERGKNRIEERRKVWKEVGKGRRVKGGRLGNVQ